MKRTVADVMTSEVVTVHATTPFKDVVRLLEAARISAVPVLDEADRLAGIISEADLMLKQEHAGHAGGLPSGRRRVERWKAAGEFAWQVMSTPVVTISPDVLVAEAARLMHSNDVKRLVVVDARGAVIGIVSRRDLLKVFMRSDADIHREVTQEVIARRWTTQEAHVHVRVEDGHVELTGRVDRKTTAEIIFELVQAVEGVVGVVSRIGSDVDDTTLRPMIPRPWGILPRSLQRP